MIGPHVALAVMILYLLLLFVVAQWAERRRREGRSIVANPYVYALSICVYVTAWTFYGSIGIAASTGLGFLPIYLGPILAMLLGWVLIRKMIRVSKEFSLVSVSDFISFRYGRSYAIGAIVAVSSLAALAPYIALQLIAISNSLEVISGEHLFFNMTVESKLVVTILLGVFAIIFGARQTDPTGRQEGLIAAVAFESGIKLLAFVVAGLYVIGLFGGYGAIIHEMSGLIATHPEYADLTTINYTSWFSLTLIAFFAILFLPRQYHVMIAENYDITHIKKVMWLLPLYLFLMNIFIPAIAWGGLILNTPGPADLFILSIPNANGQDLIALLVFIGGLSAATAMILVGSVAVGTMMLNDLEMPYFLRRIGSGRDLPHLILNMRRLNILLVVALGYIYSLIVPYRSLADIGIVAFLAVSQFAPAALGGLYWKRGTREGAIAGLVSGLVLWIYTALVPALGAGGWVFGDLLENGPFGIALLRPASLLGLEVDVWTNSVFWTLFVNTGLYVLVSLATRPSSDEAVFADSFVHIEEGKARNLPLDRGIIVAGTVDELEDTLARYIGDERARMLVDANLARLGTTRERVDARELLELWGEFERILTGTLGPSATKVISEKTVQIRPVVEKVEATAPLYDLRQGRIYIAPEKAYEVFTDQITHGIEGLCITRSDPEALRAKLGIHETPIIQVTRERTGEDVISSTNLPLLFITIRSFVESSKKSIVMIDSIEYLVKENEGVVPEREVLDFVYQVELLSRRTRMVLAERPDFVRMEVKGDITEAKELIFTLGPLSAYLFRVFSDAMLSRLDGATRTEVLEEANAEIAEGVLFEGAQGKACPSNPESPETAGCEPEMGGAVEKRSPSAGLQIPEGLVLIRRGFFLALRRLSRIIEKHVPGFDLLEAVGGLMKSYGRSPLEVSLIPGTTYVIEDEKPARSFEIFADLIRHDMDGLCVSRYNPEVLEERYDIPSKSVIWLTQRSEAGYRTVDPTNFPRLSSIISAFLQEGSYPVVLIEGLGYLITQSNYETVLRFIQAQRDDIALRNALLLVHIDPLSLDTKELHRLESEMEPMVVPKIEEGTPK